MPWGLDPWGLLVTALFVLGCFLIIPLNERLDRRRDEARRHQAHLKRRGDRW